MTRTSLLFLLVSAQLGLGAAFASASFEGVPEQAEAGRKLHSLAIAGRRSLAVTERCHLVGDNQW